MSLRPVLLSLLVAASAAAETPTEPTEPGAVLVLTSGAAMLVQSYEVDGRLVKIVGPKGEPLIMRTKQIDLEKSKLASAKLQKKLEAKAEQAAEAAEAAELERAHAAEVRANRAADNVRPGFSTGTDTEDPPVTDTADGPDKSDVKAAATVLYRRRLESVKSSFEYWADLTDGYRRKHESGDEYERRHYAAMMESTRERQRDYIAQWKGVQELARQAGAHAIAWRDEPTLR